MIDDSSIRQRLNGASNDQRGTAIFRAIIRLDRMKDNQDKGDTPAFLRKEECPPCSVSGRAPDAVDPGGANDMNSMGVFAKPEDSVGALFCRGEMNVRELRDRVSQRIVDLAQRAIATVNVSDDPAAQMRRSCGGEGFDAIADDQHNVCLQPIKTSCKNSMARPVLIAASVREPSPARQGMVASIGKSIESTLRPCRGSRCIPVAMICNCNFGCLRIARERRLHQAELGARARDKTDATFTRHR